MDLRKFRNKPLLGILRGIKPAELQPLFETIVASGLQTVEITMNTEGAPELIKNAVTRFGKELMIGAGTVVTLKDLQSALRAGATFIVSPIIVPPVIEYCARHKIPVFPGALTPQDIYEAWQAGATMVKVFPTGCLGPDYFKEIKGPFNNIELLACGGVRPQNAKEFLSAGAAALAFGGSVFSKERLSGKQFKAVEDDVRALVSAVANR